MQGNGISMPGPASPPLSQDIVCSALLSADSFDISWAQFFRHDKAPFVRCDVVIPKPDGSHVQCKHSLSYLSALLTSNGSIADELNRRLGMARADFADLCSLVACVETFFPQCRQKTAHF